MGFQWVFFSIATVGGGNSNKNNCGKSCSLNKQKALSNVLLSVNFLKGLLEIIILA
jgi:hypothetical protein